LRVRFPPGSPYRSSDHLSHLSLRRGGFPRTGLRSPLSRFDSERRGHDRFFLPVHADSWHEPPKLVGRVRLTAGRLRRGWT